MIVKRATLILPIVLYILLHAPSVSAAEKNFASRYDVNYNVSDSGLTQVKQEVTITNLTSKFYVSTYSFTIGSEEIKDIKAWGPTGSLNPKVKRKEGEVVITINFRARVFGEGRKLKFGISYNFPGLARKDGLIWTINLLRITGLKKTSSYNLNLFVSKELGPLIYSFPPSKQTVSKKDQWLISYTKTDLLKGPPRLAFGKFQLYQLNLTYHLENPSFGLGYTEIALPPDIPSQQQIITVSLLPNPVNIQIDADGNYLARYNLGPREKKEIVWEGLVALFYYPRVFTEQKMGTLPQEIVALYTKEAKYWEVKNDAVVAQARSLFDPDLTVAANVREIFRFVTNYLSYDYSKITSGGLNRLGAATSLQENNKATCMEFTDLFITLIRASGIPAREINGFAYTIDSSYRPLSLHLQGGDILHAWPEVYFPGSGWVMVDPTWSSTSGSDYFSVFDFSHITFVRKGISSEYPLPAGSYKTGPEQQRDVKVSFSQDTSSVNQLPQLSVEVNFPLLSIAPFPTTGSIRVVNTSNVAAFDAKLSFTSNLLKVNEGEIANLRVIPPGGTVETQVRLVPESFTTKGEEELTVSLLASSFFGDEVVAWGQGKTTVYPLYLPLPPSYLITIVIGIFIFISLGRFLTKAIRG